MIENWQHWPDAQISYALDQDMLATCVHLQLIERAMRAGDIERKPTHPEVVEAECRLDEAALDPVVPVSYREWLESERGEAGWPQAALYCEACRARIMVVHPNDATPWFPQTAVQASTGR